MKGFKQIFSALTVMVVMLAVTSFVTEGAPLSGQKPEPSMQKPIIPTAIACPKIAIKEVRITLLSTEVGMPLIEFPKDRVSITVTLQNVGGVNLKADPLNPELPFFSIHLHRLLDRQLVYDAQTIFAIPYSKLSKPGNTASLSFPDTFTHGLRGYVYDLTIPDNGRMGRCQEASYIKPMQILIDENALHSSGRQILTGQ